MKNYFKTLGWLFLPPHILAYDKQKHGLLAIWLTMLSFPITQTLFNSTRLWASIISFVFVGVVGFGIEYYQKWFTTDRVFDVKDATIMIKINAIMLVLWNLWIMFVL
jgi:hypothetical protein